LAGDDHAARATSSITSDSGRFLALATKAHLFGHHALTGVMHLRHVAFTTTLSIQALRMNRLEKGAFATGGRWEARAQLRIPDATGAASACGCIRGHFPAPH